MKSFIEHIQYLEEGKLIRADLFKRKNKELFINMIDNGKPFISVKDQKLPTKNIRNTPEWQKLKDQLNNARYDAELSVKWNQAFKELTSFAIGNIEKIENGFSTVSGSNPSGAQWEALIAIGLYKANNEKANIKEFAKHKPNEWNTAQKFWDDWENQAIQLGKEFKNKLKINDIQNIGGSSIQLNPEWQEMISKYQEKKRKGDTTPKTDLLSSSKNIKISLKKAGGSQIMSAKKFEAIATAYAALYYLGENNKAKKDMDNLAKEFAKNLVYMETKGNMEDLRGLAAEDPTSPLAKEIQNLDDKKEYLNQKVNDYINNNDEYKAAFCWEAATGQFKFGEKSLAAANYIVTFSDEGYLPAAPMPLKNYKTDGAKLAKKTKFRVGIKTAGGQASLSLRGEINEPKKKNPKADEVGESFRSIIQEEVSNNLQLSEDVWSKFESYQLNEYELLDKIKNYAQKTGEAVLKKVAETFEKIKQRLYAAIDKLKALGKEFIAAVLNFFGVYIEDINITQDDYHLFTEPVEEE